MNKETTCCNHEPNCNLEMCSPCSGVTMHGCCNPAYNIYCWDHDLHRYITRREADWKYASNQCLFNLSSYVANSYQTKEGAQALLDIVNGMQNEIRLIWEKINQILKKLQTGFTMVVSPETWSSPEDIFTAEVRPVDENDRFENIKLYVNDELVEEVEDAQSYTFDFTMGTPGTVKCIGTINGTEFIEEKLIEENIHITDFVIVPNTIERGVETALSFLAHVTSSVSRIEVKQENTLINSGSGHTLAFVHNITATTTDNIPFTAYVYQNDLLVDQRTVNVTVTEPVAHDEFWIGAGALYTDVMVDANKHEVVNNTMDGTYEVAIENDGDRFFIIMKSDMKDRYYQNKGLFMLFEVPMVENTEGEYTILTSRNQYEAGIYNTLEIKSR